MNQLETAYATEILDPLKAAGEILEWWFEEWKWRLKAKGTWFTPDFVVMRGDGTLEVHETKGFMQEDAWLKLKLFEALYPLAVYVVRRPKRKAEPWEVRPVGDSPQCPFLQGTPAKPRQTRIKKTLPADPAEGQGCLPAWPR